MQQPLKFNSVSEQRGREIAVTGIRQESDDRLAFILRPFCQFNGCPDGGTGGNAHKNALGFADLFAGCESVFILHGDDFVVNAGIEYLRHKPGADSLNRMRPALSLG